MAKTSPAYNHDGSLSDLYLQRKEQIEDKLTPMFALLLNDGFTYNDIRCMLLDSTIEFLVQQSYQQLKAASQANLENV